MHILFIGDIYASPGRRIVADHLHRIVTEERIDLIIANVENSAGGFGVTPQIAEDMLSMGVEVMTTGNHVWDKSEIHEYLPRQPRLLRPANYPPMLPGTGMYVGKARNGAPYAVLNLQGRTFMATIDDPFRKVDELLGTLPEDVKAIAPDVLRHRVLPTYEAEADGLDAERIVRRLLDLVAVDARRG
jgi:calcineurin-like phosphoesterase